MIKDLPDNRKPKITKGLVSYLDSLYPNVLPRNKRLTIDELRILQGQREVVDYLIQLYEQED